MADDESIEEDIEEEIDIFLDSLNKDDFKNLLSASEIKFNFETMNEILDPLRDLENEFQNPSLKIAKTVRKNIQIITPKKELNEENSNLIKDILHFRKGYEANAIEANNTIEKVKENFKELSDSVTQLIKLIEEVKNKYFEHAKEMMTPFTKKNEEFEKIDKSKLSKALKQIGVEDLGGLGGPERRAGGRGGNGGRRPGGDVDGVSDRVGGDGAAALDRGIQAAPQEVGGGQWPRGVVHRDVLRRVGQGE